MTTKQTTHNAKLKAAGWRRTEVWLSPEDAERLAALQRASGASAQAVLRRGLREMPLDLSPEAESAWFCYRVMVEDR